MVEKNLVIIDDDIEDTELFVDGVKTVFPSYSCIPFTDACAALEYLKEVKIAPTVIIIDLTLRDLPAEECLIEIAKIEALKGVKVVIHSSAMPNQAVLDSFRSSGAHFFRKPSSQAEFENVIRAMLS